VGSLRYGDVSQAVEALSKGGVVIIPTETVVGLVAAEAGLERVRDIKGRDADKPIALLCATKNEALSQGRYSSPLAGRLAELYWPGPLTLVLNRAEVGTIGVRVPDHETARDLLADFGGPLYATSANLAGAPAPAKLEEVDVRVREAVDVIVEGKSGGGVASAVVDLSGDEVRLIRAGADLTQERLDLLAGECGF
jgi:L-threonylcarbamoyladenylate synthase